ncbi:MAG: hypothetical protein ACLQLC_16565 [Candidatus Sulfotelmatobacter sp.]
MATNRPAPNRSRSNTSLTRDPYLEGDNQVQLDEHGKDPGQVGPDSAGQSGNPQGLSHIAEANEESVEGLADTDQAIEAAAVEGVEDAANHPERPTHTHEEYGRPNDVPPRRKSITTSAGRRS